MKCDPRNRFVAIPTFVLVVAVAVVAACTSPPDHPTPPPDSPSPDASPGSAGAPDGPPSVIGPIGRGEALFHDRRLVGLGGNGRACSDCHVDSDSFQLSPAIAEARFQRMIATGVDDPLFRPIDADDFVASGDAASDYDSLRHQGLIRVRMPLPANIKLVDPASCMTGGVPAPCETATSYLTSPSTFTDVWRAVPSVLNVSVSGSDSHGPVWPRDPGPQGGYQLDGRVDTLQNQARAAFLSHAQVMTVP